MKKNNRVFLGLIFLVLAIASWQGFKCIKKICYYYSLDQRGTATITTKEVVQKKRDKYQILVGVQFFQQDKEIETKVILPKIFLNPWAAQEALKKMNFETISIFFSSKQSRVVDVRKDFPVNALLSFLILIMLLLYFLLLKFWNEREEKKTDVQTITNA